MDSIFSRIVVVSVACEIAGTFAATAGNVIESAHAICRHDSAARRIAGHKINEVRAGARPVGVVTARAGRLVLDDMQPVRKARQAPCRGSGNRPSRLGYRPDLGRRDR